MSSGNKALRAEAPVGSGFGAAGDGTATRLFFFTIEKCKSLHGALGRCPGDIFAACLSNLVAAAATSLSFASSFPFAVGDLDAKSQNTGMGSDPTPWTKTVASGEHQYSPTADRAHRLRTLVSKGAN